MHSETSLQRAVLLGGLGFMLASLCVFATVAFAERWMYNAFGLIGAYIAWTVLFVFLGGSVLGILVEGTWRLPRFYLLFALAFLAYATAWFISYFFLRGTAGEWIGSLVGSLAMGTILCVALGATRSALKLSALLFVANSIGYFLGSAVNDAIVGRIGMLLWGAIYGLCLGAGLSAVLHFAQRKR